MHYSNIVCVAFRFKQKYVDFHVPDSSVTNKNGMLTVTSSVKMSPRRESQQPSNRSSWNRSKSQTRRSFNEFSDTQSNRNSQRTHPHNDQSFDMQSSGKLYKGRGRNNNESSDTPFNNGRGHTQSNSDNYNRGYTRNNNDQSRTNRQNTNRSGQSKNFNTKRDLGESKPSFSFTDRSSLQVRLICNIIKI